MDVLANGNFSGVPSVLGVAGMTSSELRYATLAAGVGAVAPGIRPEIVASYVEMFERLFVVELVPAFAPAGRCRHGRSRFPVVGSGASRRVPRPRRSATMIPRRARI